MARKMWGVPSCGHGRGYVYTHTHTYTLSRKERERERESRRSLFISIPFIPMEEPKTPDPPHITPGFVVPMVLSFIQGILDVNVILLDDVLIERGRERGASKVGQQRGFLM